MRSREEILKDQPNEIYMGEELVYKGGSDYEFLQLEVLLDIRDLLQDLPLN